MGRCARLRGRREMRSVPWLGDGSSGAAFCLTGAECHAWLEADSTA